MLLLRKLKSFFKSEKLKANHKDLVQTLIALIFDDLSLSTPQYCPHITSTDDAHQHREKLPLVYICKENLEQKSFSLSVNGFIVGRLLEDFCARPDPHFPVIRDKVMAVIHKASLGSVMEMCERSSSLPSELFAHFE